MCLHTIALEISFAEELHRAQSSKGFDFDVVVYNPDADQMYDPQEGILLLDVAVYTCK